MTEKQKRQQAEDLKGCLDRLEATNYVATINLDVCKINLKKIAQQQPACTYHRETFAALSWREDKPRLTALLYPLGVMVCMGGKSKATTLRGCMKCVKRLNQFGVKCRMTGFKIDNVVSSTLSYPLNLQECNRTEWSSFVRLTKRFPGARVRCEFMKLPIKTKVVAAIFKSGKINLTAADTLEEEREVLKYIDEIILQKIRCKGARYVRRRVAGQQEEEGEGKGEAEDGDDERSYAATEGQFIHDYTTTKMHEALLFKRGKQRRGGEEDDDGDDDDDNDDDDDDNNQSLFENDEEGLEDIEMLLFNATI
jgi:transcription initiation factor TFIID TATA-box-binding protein